jgi:hypothetical protein
MKAHAKSRRWGLPMVATISLLVSISAQAGAAGVQYHVGREARRVYDEKWNGVQTGVLHHRHHFGVLKSPVDPYVVPFAGP